MFRASNQILSQLDKSDVFLEIRDARIPYSSGNIIS
jgi:ribosome biogenesis GTPase A